MPKNSKKLGLSNSGWVKRKYNSDEEKKVVYLEKQKEYYAKHKQAAIARNWKTQIGKLGCSVELYEQFFSVQSGRCALCRKAQTRRLAVDHCHATGKIRGLLCSSCNTALHMIDNNPNILERIGEYLCLPPR